MSDLILPTIALIVSATVLVLTIKQDREWEKLRTKRNRELGFERKRVWFWQAKRYVGIDGWHDTNICGPFVRDIIRDVPRGEGGQP
ncbi:MAG: hypothetical protein ACTHOP_08030 [Mesorhizobium sp.]